MSFRSVTHATILSHTKEDSVLTYETAITGVTVVSASEDVIDEADAVAASSSALPKSAEEVKSPSRQTPLSEPPQERNDDPKNDGGLLYVRDYCGCCQDWGVSQCR